MINILIAVRNTFLIVLFLVIGLLKGFTQQDKKLNSIKLKVELTLVDKFYENKDQALANLSFTNTGNGFIPASGWSIYFNFKNSIVPKPGATEQIKIEQLNGNLFRITPLVHFKGIAPGESSKTEILIEDGIKNVTDEPDGFYWIQDNRPQETVAINEVKVMSAGFSTQELADNTSFNRKIYENNASLLKFSVSDEPKVFPEPQSSEPNGTTFILDQTVQLVTDPQFMPETETLAAHLTALLGRKPTINGSNAKKTIVLRKDDSVFEGYELEITNDHIFISASGNAGIFYGIQSLTMLLPTSAFGRVHKEVKISGQMIKDAPRFNYRGLMLDVARNFQTKEEILRMIDLMALYKLNVLHFHLNDDEGWRLEIEGLPELTDIGAKRGHSLDSKTHLPAAYGSGGETGKLYGSGFYTKSDFIEILKYAAKRHIQVIPELETPGHARAAIKAMDARYVRLMTEGKTDEARMYLLKDPNDQSKYSTAQRWTDNVMDVALPSTYNFISKVTDEIAKMYTAANLPLQTLHIGGDEVPSGAWEKSPSCEALIRNHPEIKNTDGLWYYYLNRVHQILSSRNIKVSGWEEIAFRKTQVDGRKATIVNPQFVNSDFSLYVWNNINGNEDLAYRLANAGYPVVLTFVTNFYFDMAHYRTYHEPGYYWGGLIDLNKTYSFIPFDYLKNVKEDQRGKPLGKSVFTQSQRLTDYGQSNVKGIQGAIWSETIKGPDRLEYMLLPRLLALAERAWSKEPDWALTADSLKSEQLYRKSWAQFITSVNKYQLPRLDQYQGGFKYRIPMVGTIVQDGAVLANIEPGAFQIRYTTDGSVPTINSKLYTGPIVSNNTIKLRAFTSNKRFGEVTIVNNKK